MIVEFKNSKKWIDMFPQLNDVPYRIYGVSEVRFEHGRVYTTIFDERSQYMEAYEYVRIVEDKKEDD